jgi:glyoxylase-like metal-dependent hydrolase (beta-lactamase superfamily II)
MTKAFASRADLEEKRVTFDRLSEHAYAYTAEGDPNTGIVIGDDAVLVADAQATPVMAQDVLRHIRTVSDKPVRYVVLTHYHAVRVLGASGYSAQEIIASQDTYDLIVERGAQDMQSEIERFPRLFRAVESVPGLTWPTLTFRGEMTVWLGKLEVKLMQVGRGHTKGDTIVWLPRERVLFSGDLVEYGATPYAGDAYFKDWPRTLEALEALGAEKLVPGRGAALTDRKQVAEGLANTRAFVSELYAAVASGAREGKDLRAIYRDTVRAFAAAIDIKDKYTQGHSERVGKYSEIIAREMGWPDEEVEGIAIAGYLHDIGKLVVERDIINAPYKIDAKQSSELNRHPAAGFEILAPIHHPYADIPLMARYHHERIDGRGYPDGLSGEEIPLGARIVSLADSFDAMTTDRPYKTRRIFCDVIEDFRRNTGKQFDCQVVLALCRALLKEMNGTGTDRRMTKMLGKNYLEAERDTPLINQLISELDPNHQAAAETGGV